MPQEVKQIKVYPSGRARQEKHTKVGALRGERQTLGILYLII